MTRKVGVVALQGAFDAHERILRGLGVEATEVRRPEDLRDVEALILPGGESTTISMLLESSGLYDELASRLADGLPVLGTCAGMILLADQVIDGRPDQRPFRVIDLDIRRNAYGRQVDSFETEVSITGVDGPPFEAVFIRAPVVERVGADVEVLASVEGRPVLCRQGSVWVAAFHPELGDDPRLHSLYLESLE